MQSSATCEYDKETGKTPAGRQYGSGIQYDHIGYRKDTQAINNRIL